MIWDSIALMTIIDVGVLVVGVFAGILLFKYRRLGASPKKKYDVILVGAGALAIVGFYISDLVTMWVLPPIVGMEAAMSSMAALHLNYSWLVISLGFGAVMVGFSRTIVGVANISRDLQTSEARYRNLVENSQFGIRIERLGGERVFANEMCFQIFGYDSAEEYLRTLSKPGTMIAPHDRERMLKNMQARSEGKNAADEYEYDAIRKDGSIVPVQVFVREIIWKDEPALLRTFIDISNRREIEKAGHESDARFRAFFDNSSSIMYVKDRDLRFSFVNAEYLDFHGLDLELVIGKRGEASLDDEKRIKLEDLDRQVMELDQSASYELPYTSKSGEIREFFVTKFPVHGADGEVNGVGGISTDVTELHERERDLIGANLKAENAAEKANAANAAKSEFLANMSHELRTPLNAVIGFSEMFMKGVFGPLGDSRYLDYARDINASGNHLLRVITDILDLSKIESGRMELKESRIDIARVAKEAMRMVRGKADDGHLALEAEIADNMPLFDADERAVKQMLINLLSNAIKFTEPGGAVVVRAFLSDDSVTISISDTGIGMHEDEIQVALEPFRQIDGSLARQHDGTGLGLPLVKSLIGLHGGSFDLTTAPGVGTTITLGFPASRMVWTDTPPPKEKTA